jgi:predicted AlkP superfamily phosphohydrolase/phosphomutase/tetratricopeptide (TPR) repeat protein
MRRRPALAIAAGAALFCSTVVHIPRGSVAVVAWRGGGTPSLLGAGFGFRLPVLQTVYRYPGGRVTKDGETKVSSREGNPVSIPYHAECQPEEQALLALHQEGRKGGAAGALGELVDGELRKAAAAFGTYDLASGIAADVIQAQIGKALQDKFGSGSSVTISPANLPTEVRARFSHESIFGRRRDTGRNVLIVGLDGADWDVINPMIVRGELPNLARLKGAGVWARMRSNVPTLSPLLWTTVATGKAPDKHGINDFLVVDRKSGRQVPINSTFRKVKALWNILSEADLSNDVIAWWATWPVEAITGHMISDRVSYSTWDVARPEESRGSVHPPEYSTTVARLRVGPEAIPYGQIAEFVHVSEGEFREANSRASKETGSEDKESIKVLTRVLAATETYRKIALDLLESRRQPSNPARLFAVYFQGIDEVNHRFAHCTSPRTPQCSVGDSRRFKDALGAFYRYQDRIVGEILARAPEATVIVLSDHGFKSGENRPNDSKPFIEDQPGFWHNLSGIFIASGPAIGKGEIPAVTLYDVAPTVLYLLGLPVPEDMPGRVLEPALAPGVLAAAPVAKVPSYETLPLQEASDSGRNGGARAGATAAGEGGGSRPHPKGEALQASTDDEIVDQLRSLGYVGAGRPAGGSGSASPGAAGVPTLLYHTNLGTVYLGKKQYDRAEAEYLKALALDPRSAQALTDLAALYELRGESEKALEQLRALERVSSPGEPAPYARMADLFIKLGRHEDGLAFLRRIESRQGSGQGAHDVPLEVGIGMLEAAAGRRPEAERSFLKAVSIDPVSVPAMQELFALYDAEGRATELESRIRAAISRSPRSPMHHNWLGLVLRRRGDLPGAEAELRKALELAPGLVGSMANLGSLYLQEAKYPEAVAILRHATERDRQSVESRTNLIVAYGMVHELAEARREVTEAEADGQKEPFYYNALAYALHVNGQDDEALATLRKSLAINPRQPDALRLRSQIERGGQDGGGP